MLTNYKTMTNYKLTTNLIADCMALIPHNLELLNENYDFFASGDMDVEYFFNELHPRLKFLNLSHCLRTIQEFKRIQPLYYYYHNQRKNAIEKLEKEGLSYQEIKQKLYMPGATNMLVETWKTIASATLHGATRHGQGEYPPSTLEELCESYKNVMSKQN